ncbi:MAG: hypothetical protein PVJ43_09115 [Gemmatimonadales bacterium]|jgi:hypothetical protein
MLIARLVPVLLCSAALVACEGTSEPEITVPEPTPDEVQDVGIKNENPFLGAWRLTSAVLGDDELVPGSHFSYVMTFWGDGTHSASVSGDFDHLVCGAPDTSCDWSGMYSYTGTTLTTVEPDHPDSGERGEDTSLYAVCGNKLIFMDEAGDEDERVGIRLTLQRTRQDCYVRDCS